MRTSLALPLHLLCVASFAAFASFASFACVDEESKRAEIAPRIVARALAAEEPLPAPQDDTKAASLRPVTPWKITRAVYKYSTYDTSKVGYPSDGPGKTYVLTAEAHPEFQPLILQVLDETKVNNEVTLRAYIDLLRSGDRDEVQRIDALGPSPRQPTGSGVNRSFAIYDGENQVYEFVGNFRRYSGDHVVNLYKLTIDPKNQLPVDPLDSAHPAEEHRLPRRSTSPPPPSPQE